MERLTQGKEFEEYQNALNQVKLVERNATPNGVAIVDPKRSGKRASDDLVTLAREIQHANIAIKNSACSKLTIIAEQVRFLQNQAKKILEESEQNANLHHAACNFQKVPGKIYHLYKRESGQTYFSMLSPEEWGPTMAHEYLGSYRLEQDQSWVAVEDIEEHNKNQQWAENLLNSRKRTANFLCLEEITDGNDN